MIQNANVNENSKRRIPWVWLVSFVLLAAISIFVTHDAVAGVIFAASYLVGLEIARVMNKRIDQKVRIALIVIVVAVWFVLPGIVGTPLTPVWNALLNISTGFAIGLVVYDPPSKTTTQPAEGSASK